jgi:hypothetical protein
VSFQCDISDRMNNSRFIGVYLSHLPSVFMEQDLNKSLRVQTRNLRMIVVCREKYSIISHNTYKS